MHRCPGCTDVLPITEGGRKGSIYGYMSATDSPSDPPDRSRVLRWTSEDLRQHSRTLRQHARRLIESSRELRDRLGSFLKPPPPTQSA